jgi:ribosomal protein S19
MLTDKYRNNLKSTLKKKKITWWLNGRKFSPFFCKKIVVIPKGIFFRVVKVKKTQIGQIIGSLVSTRKPFVRPTKEIRR